MITEITQEEIDATHPEGCPAEMYLQSLEADQFAMELVHDRHGKRELVNLVRFLLLKTSEQ